MRILFLLLSCFCAHGYADISVNFDTGSNWTAGGGSLTSYQTNHVYAESGFSFSGGPALRQTTAVQDGVAGALGTYSWRLQDVNGVAWTASYDSVSLANSFVSGFGFDVRRWDGSPVPVYDVSYSFDGGVNYTSAGTINNTFLGGTSNWTSFSASFGAIQVANGDFKVRVSRTGGERIMIDNFSLTATAVPEPSSIGLVVLGLAAVSSTCRRRA